MNQTKTDERYIGWFEDLTSEDVAVRSSATAEDPPEASFAGQQETFLIEQNIDSISLNPDSVVAVKRHAAEIEKGTQRGTERALQSAGME